MRPKAMTMGDPAGIGPEICLKALIADDSYRESTLIIGSESIVSNYSDLINNTIPLAFISEPEAFEKGKINVISLPLGNCEIGKVSAAGGDAAYRYVETAIAYAMEGRVGAVITGPLNKEALHMGGHPYDGHTEIFAELTHTKKVTMMLWSEKLSVVHVSTHVSLRQACDLVKKERILDCITLADETLKRMGIAEPKIAVAGLNPHSGESGLFGEEDRTEIRPAVEEAVKLDFNAVGPLPPDTVYLQASKGKYDCVVAMYHDQGHIPMKLLAFDSGVNVTLGLPIIRTSVDHGTAFDIAGKGLASEESMLAALEVSKRLT
ncbi:MAG: 4-hydroxythreonine-4-phosphate dehydrogenase PdxA [Alkalibacterium sp.]|nr:4-hydroxythreonine-4-phosphate dehydrogenase PdxA [Alkalibacterium sp.]